MARFGTIGTQYFDDAGDPLINGFLYFYDSGTTTRKNTYADINLSIPNTNPVQLTAAGRQPNVFFAGTAKVILTKSTLEQVEVRDPVGGEAEEGVFSPWNSLTIYDVPDIVQGSDGNFYITISSGNQGNDPTTDEVNWTQIRFVRAWNANETYKIDQVVQAENGLLYVSLVNSNLNNDPIADTISWGGATTANIPALVKASSKIFGYSNLG